MDVEHALRLFELDLLQSLGYGLQLEYDFETNQRIDASKQYHFDALQGPFARKDGIYSGNTLIALQNKLLKNKSDFSEAKKLMRAVIDFHLDGKQLKSRELIVKVLKQVKN
jgi:DNA repair protein RecO (recombination protein O)